ncbi:MAG: hybrid sensor histidine kinase/response regulator [Pedobacter sp.]|nr:hybrid sensor histidine kinase/response regulator [Pedobacter sp.]
MGLFDQRERASSASAVKKPRYGLLLVDDEILNLTSLASLLEDDYRVHLASDANDALQQLTNPNFAAGIHIIVSDQRMPGMTGVELLGRTRHLCPGAKRILLTGYTDIDAIVGAINEAAIWKYLRKPIDSQELKLTLARACEAWQLEQENMGLLGELKRAFAQLSLLDADKMTFLRYLAHEMNTPLNWLSAAQVIDRSTLSTETREMLDFVDQGQNRLRGLISAVLRYFQAAGLELQPHREQVDLSVLLSRQITNLQRVHGQSVMMRLEQPVTLTIESDAALILELLDHMLENALTHVGPGPGSTVPEVRITVSRQDNDFSVEISNSGDSLNEEALGRLFQPFFFCGSAHGSEGFGLSLATARALAIALGGDIQARSGQTSQPGLSLMLRLPLVMPANSSQS